MALGMQVLILNCGVQQILAGEVTRGGLLSFLLYQKEVGHYVRVSEMPQDRLWHSFWTFGP